MKRFARPEDLSAAKARVDQAKAQANLIKKQIVDSYIIAPVAGTITYKPVEEGELIGTGSIVVRISRLERMELMIYVPESQLPNVALNGTAEVKVDAFKGKSFSGRVVFISSVAEFTPKNIQTKEERTKLVFGVKIKVANPDGSLKAGLPADVTLTQRQGTNP